MIAILCIIVLIWLIGIFTLIFRPGPDEYGKVILSRFLLIVGVICMSVFLIPIFIFTFIEKSVLLSLAFLAFSVLGAVLVIAYLNCRIWYDDDGFTHKNFWGVKRRYKYTDIAAINEHFDDTYLYVGKRRIVIDWLSLGNRDLIILANKKYKESYGKPIPKTKKLKYDIFNGHISDPGGILVAFVLGYLVIIILAILIVSIIWDNPFSNFETVQASFSSCYRDDEDINLMSVDGDKYIIRFVPEEYDTKKIEAICDGYTVLDVQVKRYTSKDKSPYYLVKSIYKNKIEIISKNEISEFQKNRNFVFIWFPIGFFILWSGCTVVSIIVGRNPKKYAKYVKLFFKPGYIIW